MYFHKLLPYSDFVKHAVTMAAENLPIWFDSASSKHQTGRYSFVMCNPIRYYKPPIKKDIFTLLSSELTQNSIQIPEMDLPFYGGLAGYFSYDFGASLLDIDPPQKSLIHIPDYYWGVYDAVLYADHHNQKAGMITLNLGCQRSPKEKTDYLLSLPEKQYRFTGGTIQTVETEKIYKKSIQTIQSHIEKGDIFQANIARYFHCTKPRDFNPLAYYLQLRQINPAPFGLYLQMEEGAILSSSPERFLKVEKGKIETKPIKGTLSSSKPSEDLRNSAKDRAENIMVTDMLRNDLSKVAKTGSVHVSDYCVIESYEGLHHLVSTVTAELHSNMDCISLLKESMPGGSITGTPKKHACELIYKIEKKRRSAYCGTAGYIGFNGTMDMNILIRTVLCDEKNISFGAGCGITYESNPDAEWEESNLKANKILQSFKGISKTLP